MDRVLTELNIGVKLPDKINIARQIAVMSLRAPVFFIMFFVSMLILLGLNNLQLKFIPAAIISVAYFLFYPLFAYLSAYLSIILSFGLAYGILGLLIFNYARMVFNLKFGLAIWVSYTFFLGITSIAALLPTYTGLILTIEGVALLAIVMQIMPKMRNISINQLLTQIVQTKGVEDDIK